MSHKKSFFDAPPCVWHLTPWNCSWFPCRGSPSPHSDMGVKTIPTWNWCPLTWCRLGISPGFAHRWTGPRPARAASHRERLVRSTLKADDVGRQVMQKGVVFLQNTLRPARDLKGKTKKQIASARITESLVGTRGTHEYFPSLIRWSFFGCQHRVPNWH